MSIVFIDALTYKQLFHDTIDRYVKNGMKITQATIHAQALMDNSFRIGDAGLELEKDQMENGIYG
jgi:hypothetical protein